MKEEIHKGCGGLIYHITKASIPCRKCDKCGKEKCEPQEKIERVEVEL